MPDRPEMTVDQLNDFVGRASKLWKIRTKDNRLVNYVPNEGQQMLNEIIREEQERSMAHLGVNQVKLVVLKSRQVGISTDTAMRNLDALITIPMCNTLVLAHDGMTTELLYDIYRRGYDNMPQQIDVVDDQGNFVQTVDIKPEEKSYTGKRLQFQPPLDSRLTVQTAGAGDNVGKGITLNRVHFSEFANYTDANNVFNSTNQALPKNGDVYAVIESTANGVSGIGESFYNLWKKSTKEWENFQQGRQSTFEGYRPVFLPWYKLSEYRKPLIHGKLTTIETIDFGSPEDKKKFLETEELLMQEYDVPIEGINWYRDVIKEKCSYSLREAKRYYPTFPEDAFLATDNGFFDSTKLHTVLKDLEANPPEYERGRITEDIEFDQDRHGQLEIITHPDPSYMNRYIVSLDPSTGVEDGDYAPMKVYDRLTQQWVARWYGREDEDVLAEEFMRLGYYYNEALLIPERNLATVINIIKPDGVVPYTGPVWVDENKRGDVQYGFQTNIQTRKMLLDGYKAWIRDNYDKLMDKLEVEEHLNFIKVAKHGTVKYEAAPGHHDDIVIANALTIWAADNWDEDLAELNQDQSDIERIVTLKPANKRVTRHHRLGLKKVTFDGSPTTKKMQTLGVR